MTLLFIFPGPVSSVLVSRFGSRPIVMIGGLMCGVSMVTASFGSSIVYLYLSIGIIGGIAQLENLFFLSLLFFYCFSLLWETMSKNIPQYYDCLQFYFGSISVPHSQQPKLFFSFYLLFLPRISCSEVGSFCLFTSSFGLDLSPLIWPSFCLSWTLYNCHNSWIVVRAARGSAPGQ